MRMAIPRAVSGVQLAHLAACGVEDGPFCAVGVEDISREVKVGNQRFSVRLWCGRNLGMFGLSQCCCSL